MTRVAPSWRVWVRRLVPWIVTIAVIAFLLHRYPVSAIRAEMSRGDALPLIPLAALAASCALVLMATADWLVLRASLGPIRWWDVICGKAGTSMLIAIGHGVGAGAYGVWLARKTSAGVRTTIGMIGYIMISDLTALCMLATASVWLAGHAIDVRARTAVGVVAPSIAVAMIAAALLGPRLLRRWVRDPQLVKPWSTVAPGMFAASIAIRGLNLAVATGTTALAAKAFGLAVPLSAMVSYLPIIFVIGALPINIAGFGAVQLMWVQLFSRWAPGEQILAFQFLFHVMVTALLIVRGAPFLGRVVREIALARATSSATGGDAPPDQEAAGPGSTPT
jgi:hypothetical protein